MGPVLDQALTLRMLRVRKQPRYVGMPTPRVLSIARAKNGVARLYEKFLDG